MKNTHFFLRASQAVFLTAIIACVMFGNLWAMTLSTGNTSVPYMPGPEFIEQGYQVPAQSAPPSPLYQPEGYKPEGYQSEGYRPGVHGVKVTTVLGGLGVERSPQVTRLLQEAEEMARRLELDVETKVASLKKAAEESVAKMKTEVERKVEDEAIKLNKDAAAQVMNIINKADEESLKLRKKEREETLIRRLSRRHVVSPVDREPAVRLVSIKGEPSVQIVPVGKQPVPREWRRAMTREFNANTLLMKQIIMEGEDAEQLPDFLQRFNDQRLWFDRTLRGTQYVNDPNYHQVVNKQVKLRKIINAQRKADAVVVEVAQTLKLSDYEHKKLRLLALYELNSFAQKNVFTAGSAIKKIDQLPRQIEFTDPVIRQLILKVADEVTGRIKKAYPDFKVLDEKAIVTLAVGVAPVSEHAGEIKKLRSMVDTAAQEKRVTKQHLKQKLEEQGKELAEYQLTAKRLESELDRLHKQTATDQTLFAGAVQDRMKREFGLKLEEKERDSLDLKLQLTSANQKIDVLDRQIKQAKDELDRMNMQLLMAQDDTKLAKKHVEDLRYELEEQRKLKNLALEKVKLIDEVADRRVDEHVGAVTQRLVTERQDIKKLERACNEKEEALKKAEHEYQEKERLLSKKEKEIEEQRTLLQDMRKGITKDRDVLSGIRDETKIVMDKFSQLARAHEKEMATIKGSTQVVTEAANRQALKAELKEKKQDQADKKKM